VGIIGAHLEGAHGTLECRGTQVEKHWPRHMFHQKYSTIAMSTFLFSYKRNNCLQNN